MSSAPGAREGGASTRRRDGNPATWLRDGTQAAQGRTPRLCPSQTEAAEQSGREARTGGAVCASRPPREKHWFLYPEKELGNDLTAPVNPRAFFRAHECPGETEESEENAGVDRLCFPSFRSRGAGEAGKMLVLRGQKATPAQWGWCVSVIVSLWSVMAGTSH